MQARQSKSTPEHQAKHSQYTGVLVLFLTLSFLTVSAFFFLQMVRGVKQQNISLPIYGEIPAFNFPDHRGRNVNLETLRGKVWIAAFIFTRCGGPCPLVSGRMADIQNSLPDLEKVKLVSFTVDPDFDTEEVLSRYAEGFGAKDGVWFFLRGEKEKILSLTQKGFLLAVSEGNEDPNHVILHSTRLVVVDARGRIRGYYDSENPQVKGQILRDTGILIAEKNKKSQIRN
jgi:cytochrome oxidase Cu insertion factor (SCO1/SenC/PrrC family)